MNMNFKIIIRPVTEVDRTLFIKLFSDPLIMKYIGKPLKESEINIHFNALLKKLDKNKFWLDVIDLVLQNKKVKSVGILQLSKENDAGKTGVMLLSEYHGMNIALDAKKMILEKAIKCKFSQKLIAYCNAKNISVNKLYNKLGFKLVCCENTNSELVNKWEKQLFIDK